MYEFSCRIYQHGYDLVTEPDEARFAVHGTLGDRECTRVGPVNWCVPLTEGEHATIARDGLLRVGVDPQVVFRRRWRSEAHAGVRA